MRFPALALRDDADAIYSNFVWSRQVWQEPRAVMGADPWMFGSKYKELVLNAIVRYAGEQELLAKSVTIDELFIRIDEAN